MYDDTNEQIHKIFKTGNRIQIAQIALKRFKTYFIPKNDLTKSSMPSVLKKDDENIIEFTERLFAF